MAKIFILEELKERFKEEKIFNRESLLAFYRQFDPDLNDSTFRWRIHQLKAKKVITPISQDLFTLGSKPDFNPGISEFEKRIAYKVEKQFSGMKYAIWSTKSVNEFLLHLSSRSITILQVEIDALEPVYAFLKNQNIGSVYFQPDKKEIERYIFESEKSIILQSLISKAPIQKIGKTVTVKLEKIIVDLFCEKDLFISFQGSELVHIINTAYNRYAINITTMFHYARRRGKEMDLKQFLKERTNIPKAIFNDKK
ncbi:MAG: DUF6577 family protein [Bacteroidota bacterium]|nr:DUF6577 family protein [Bacteroidota bacterium]